MIFLKKKKQKKKKPLGPSVKIKIIVKIIGIRMNSQPITFSKKLYLNKSYHQGFNKIMKRLVSFENVDQSLNKWKEAKHIEAKTGNWNTSTKERHSRETNNLQFEFFICNLQFFYEFCTLCTTLSLQRVLISQQHNGPSMRP